MIARALKGKLLVFGVFFLGIASGILINNFYQARVALGDPTADRARANNGQRGTNRVHDYLGLNQEQRERVNAILEEERLEVRKLRAESRPRIEAIQQDAQTKIKAILTSDQLLRYEEYRQSVRERRSRNRRTQPGN